MLEKDLSVLQKMKEQYRLNNELSYKVYEYLVNSYKATHILTPDEEQGVVQKLSEELRGGKPLAIQKSPKATSDPL